MKLSLRRTPEATGLIYEVFDSDGKALLTVEREASSSHVWMLFFRSANLATQVVMRQDSFEGEIQLADGKRFGLLKEARFSITGKISVEDEAGRQLGSVSSGLTTLHFQDPSNRRVGTARQPRLKGRFGFLPRSQIHRFWDRELEFDDTVCDERFLYALVCFLVTSEFASSAS